ncbi:hypothetical protein AAHA92_33902 [Salvia divinorum]|uniref:Ubiquitin-like protease family profile domain-containing protein n=1 Tax=Salvia divinorum TaxID=28513 RepID=A0ABD1FH80_SALDI
MASADSAAKESSILFSQKLDMMLLKDIHRYRKSDGKTIKWKRFRKMSRLPENYTIKHVYENFQRLKKNYKRRRNLIQHNDDREALILELSESLWAAKSKTRVPLPLQNPQSFVLLSKLCGDISMPQLLRRHWDVIGEANAVKFEQQLTELQHKEFVLFHQNCALKERICAILLEIITGVKSTTISNDKEDNLDGDDKSNLEEGDVEMPDPDVQLVDKPANFTELRIVYRYCNASHQDGHNIIMLLDEALFGHDRTLYVHLEDVEPFCLLQPISYMCICVYIWYLFKKMKITDKTNRFRFVDPANIGQTPSTKTDEKLINESIERRARELAGRLIGTLPNQTVLVPCNVGAHWILTVIDPHKQKIGILDPFYHSIDDVWKQVVDKALKMFNALKQPKEEETFSWSIIKVPKQCDAFQCGFYVMKYMREIVDFDAFEMIDSLQSLFNKESYSIAVINEVRTEWADCVQDYI